MDTSIQEACKTECVLIRTEYNQELELEYILADPACGEPTCGEFENTYKRFTTRDEAEQFCHKNNIEIISE